MECGNRSSLSALQNAGGGSGVETPMPNSVKCIDQNGSMKIKKETEMNDQSSQDKAHLKNPDARKVVPPKARLHKLCAANKWEKPVFECCKEEGPDHMKLFTYKVIVEIDREPGIVLECFSGPKSKKKTAAEHAAEGALWCT